VLTQIRLANLYGYGPAVRIAAPVKFAGLTEEQMKVLKEVQKESVAAADMGKMALVRATVKAQPYPAGGAAGGVVQMADCRAVSTCHTCGVSGHWARDNKCKPTDIQAKAMRDAAAKMQMSVMPGMMPGI
jgi:Zinc knuckle